MRGGPSLVTNEKACALALSFMTIKWDSRPGTAGAVRREIKRIVMSAACGGCFSQAPSAPRRRPYLSPFVMPLLLGSNYSPSKLRRPVQSSGVNLTENRIPPITASDLQRFAAPALTNVYTVCPQ